MRVRVPLLTEMAGWGVIIAPNTNIVVRGKLLLSVLHRTVRCPCPVRLAVSLSEQVTVGAHTFSHRTVRTSHRTVQWSSLRVPPGTSRWGCSSWCTGQSDVWHQTVVPGAPDSPACGTGQSGALDRTVRLWQHIFFLLVLFFDLLNVFF
jgi:hypothetical protein